MELREYQRQLIKDIRHAYKGGVKSVLMVAGTGSGKTVIAAEIMRGAYDKGRRLLFMVHRNELLEQTVETLCRFGLEAGLIKAGRMESREKLIQIASIQTIGRRDWPDFDMLIIDEAHTGSYFKVCRELIQHCKEAGKLVLGATATPWRTKKEEGLAELYEVAVHAPIPRELIGMGFLVPCRYFSYPDCINLGNVKMTMGDYDQEACALELNKDEVFQKMITEFKRICEGRTAICFAINVEHARNIAEAFTRAGIPAKVVAGSTPLEERREIYQQLRNGQIKLISSVGVLTEGFDITSISAILTARPTVSRALNFQMIGRGLRIHAGKENCIVLDYARNVERFGMVHQLTTEDLQMDEPDKRKKDCGLVKNCPRCSAILEIKARLCPECGFEFPAAAAPKQKVIDTRDLVELQKFDKNLEHDDYDDPRHFYYVCIRTARDKNIMPSMALARFKKKYDRWPTKKEMAHCLFKQDSEQHRMSYLKHLAMLIGHKKGLKGYKLLHQIEKYFSYEFQEKPAQKLLNLLRETGIGELINA